MHFPLEMLPPARIDRFTVIVCEFKKCNMAATRKWLMRDDVEWWWCSKHHDELLEEYYAKAREEREAFIQEMRTWPKKDLSQAV